MNMIDYYYSLALSIRSSQTVVFHGSEAELQGDMPFYAARNFNYVRPFLSYMLHWVVRWRRVGIAKVNNFFVQARSPCCDMDAAASKTHLRLVGADDPSALESMRASQAVARENAAASRNVHLDPTDPRWVLAATTHAKLQGSALTHQRRQHVLRLAHRLGVRPFEANVIIAIVQDQARQGAPLYDATPTLKLLRDPREDRKSRNRGWVRWLWAIATAVLANTLLIWWLISG